MSSSRQQDLAIRGRDTAPSGSDQRSGSRKSNTSRSRPVVPVPAKENKRTNLGQRLLAFTCDGTGQMGDSKAHNARFKSNPYKTHEMLENATHEFLKVLSFYHRGPAPYLQSDVKKEQEWSKWAAAFGSGTCYLVSFTTRTLHSEAIWSDLHILKEGRALLDPPPPNTMSKWTLHTSLGGSGVM